MPAGVRLCVRENLSSVCVRASCPADLFLRKTKDKFHNPFFTTSFLSSSFSLQQMTSFLPSFLPASFLHISVCSFVTPFLFHSFIFLLAILYPCPSFLYLFLCSELSFFLCFVCFTISKSFFSSFTHCSRPISFLSLAFSLPCPSFGGPSNVCYSFPSPPSFLHCVPSFFYPSLSPLLLFLCYFLLISFLPLLQIPYFLFAPFSSPFVPLDLLHFLLPPRPTSVYFSFPLELSKFPL